jgi:hypothetical protein
MANGSVQPAHRQRVGIYRLEAGIARERERRRLGAGAVARDRQHRRAVGIARVGHDLRADGVEGLDYPRMLQLAAICSAPESGRATARPVWGGAIGLATSVIVLPTAAAVISAATRSRSGVIEMLEPATPRGGYAAASRPEA